MQYHGTTEVKCTCYAFNWKLIHSWIGGLWQKDYWQVCQDERLLCIFSFQAINITGESISSLQGVLLGCGLRPRNQWVFPALKCCFGCVAVGLQLQTTMIVMLDNTCAVLHTFGHLWLMTLVRSVWNHWASRYVCSFIDESDTTHTEFTVPHQTLRARDATGHSHSDPGHVNLAILFSHIPRKVAEVIRSRVALTTVSSIQGSKVFLRGKTMQVTSDSFSGIWPGMNQWERERGMEKEREREREQEQAKWAQIQSHRKVSELQRARGSRSTPLSPGKLLELRGQLRQRWAFGMEGEIDFYKHFTWLKKVSQASC